MTQNVNEHFDKWKADYCLRNKLDHEFLFVGCRDAYLAGYDLASHALSRAAAQPNPSPFPQIKQRPSLRELATGEIEHNDH